MRFLTSALVALALVPALARGQAPGVPTFADIPWGAAESDVLKAMAAAGLDMVEKDDEGDVRFVGRLFDTPAIVYAFMSPAHGLVKVQVRLAAPARGARRKYGEVVQTLTERYGHGAGVELYKEPYQKGDGREDEAITEGNGLLLSSWGDDAQPGQAALVVRATGPVVGLDYEAHGWTLELDRRLKHEVPTTDQGAKPVAKPTPRPTATWRETLAD